MNVRLFYRCSSTNSESQSPGGNYWNHLTAVFGELLARVLMEVVTGSCSCHSATCWVALELLDKWHDRCTSSLSTCSSTKQLRWLLVGCTRQRKQQQVCSELHVCSYFPVLLSPVQSTVCPRLSNKPIIFWRTQINTQSGNCYSCKVRMKHLRHNFGMFLKMNLDKLDAGMWKNRVYLV